MIFTGPAKHGIHLNYIVESRRVPSNISVVHCCSYPTAANYSSSFNISYPIYHEDKEDLDFYISQEYTGSKRVRYIYGYLTRSEINIIPHSISGPIIGHLSISRTSSFGFLNFLSPLSYDFSKF